MSNNIRIFLVANQLKHLQKLDPSPRLLFSYWGNQRTDFQKIVDGFEHGPPDLFFDSGAFSAARLGFTIDVAAYADWLLERKHLCSLYANLDVIGDHKGTQRNQEELEKRGLKPLPVFHAHEPFAVLEELCQEYDYIALGGVAIKKDHDAFYAWTNHCFDVSAGRAKFHGFGVTLLDALYRFNWGSVDSSSWDVNRYGMLPLFDPLDGSITGQRLGNVQMAVSNIKLLAKNGLTVADVTTNNPKDHRFDRGVITRAACQSYRSLETWLRQRGENAVEPKEAVVNG